MSKKNINTGKSPKEIQKLFKQKGLPENFCIIPFVNLIFNPTGEIGVCRQKGTNHVVGHLNENSVEEIWNNEYLQRWREEFLTGNIKICAREVKEDFCHLGALNYEYFNQVELKKKQSQSMLKFTANFNGKCNLECIMCDVWKMPNNYYDEIEFWEKAEKDFFPYIKEIELLSGEPFVQKDTWRLIDIVSSVNPDCQWSFTTNSHWKFNKKIKSYLDKIKIKNIHVSVDSLDPENYQKIRQKGKLSIVLENIDALRKYELNRVQVNKSSLGLSLHALVMKQNWEELESFLDFCETKEMMLILDLLRVPSEISLLALTEEEKTQIIERYLNTMDNNKIKRSMRIILPLIYSLKIYDQKKYFSQLIGL